MRAQSNHMNAHPWDTELTKSDRRMLLNEAYPHVSGRIKTLDAGMQWGQLLPSTQLALRCIDWTRVLGRNVFAGSKRTGE